MAGGIAVLAMVRPWRSEPDDDGDDLEQPPPDESVTAVLPRVPKRTPSPRRPRPGPSPRRRHPVEVAQRARRVPAEPGRAEIPLPDWLGPVSGGPR